MRARWLRHRGLAAFLALTVAFGYGLHEVQQLNEVRCEDRRDGREALRAVVIESFRSSSRTDFAAVPSFADLDPETQRFLNDLAELQSQSPSRAEFRDRILETIPPIECG